MKRVACGAIAALIAFEAPDAHAELPCSAAPSIGTLGDIFPQKSEALQLLVELTQDDQSRAKLACTFWSDASALHCLDDRSRLSKLLSASSASENAAPIIDRYSHVCEVMYLRDNYDALVESLR